MSAHRLFLAAIALAVLPTAVFAKTDTATDLAGRILLQVESRGEAWYVNPVDHRRYYLGRPTDVQRVMSALGLGISDADLGKIPAVNVAGSRGDRALRDRLAGRILLQVESKGEAWYVDPLSKERHPLGRPADAFRLLQTQGLGITTAMLESIPEGRTDLKTVRFSVPFTPQAPFAEWFDVRQQEGCEEASAIMAVKWAKGEPLTLMEARTKILAMADWQQEEYGYYHDTSVQDTADRLIRGFLGYDGIRVVRDIDTYDIIDALEDGKVVVTAINGRTVGNPFFAPPGPLRHMVVVTGYDAATDEFFVHDPGTKNGADFRYAHSAMESSLRDYPSGRYAPIPANVGTAMIAVSKK
jgi:hypothetical protein